jgi:hypothetical protein
MPVGGDDDVVGGGAVVGGVDVLGSGCIGVVHPSPAVSATARIL